jgi:hypothetical protein
MKLFATLHNPFSLFSALATDHASAPRAQIRVVPTTSSLVAPRRSGLQSSWQVGPDGRLELKWRVTSEI